MVCSCDYDFFFTHLLFIDQNAIFVGENKGGKIYMVKVHSIKYIAKIHVIIKIWYQVKSKNFASFFQNNFSNNCINTSKFYFNCFMNLYLQVKKILTKLTFSYRFTFMLTNSIRKEAPQLTIFRSILILNQCLNFVLVNCIYRI